MIIKNALTFLVIGFFLFSQAEAKKKTVLKNKSNEVDMVYIGDKINGALEAVSNTGNPGCASCALADQTVAGKGEIEMVPLFPPKVENPPQVAPILIPAPVNTSAEVSLPAVPPGPWNESVVSAPSSNELSRYDLATRCGTSSGGWEICRIKETGAPYNFNFTNEGPNKIVPKNNPNQSRRWEFSAMNGARQEMYFSVTDAANGDVSQLHESYMFIFPRKVLPAIKNLGDKFEVTLPTGETVLFDSKTKMVLGGVLSEGKPVTDPIRKMVPADVKYSGTGVVVKANGRGDEPRMGKESAEIRKGSKVCYVPKRDLWPDQRSSSNFAFKYSDDASFDKYLKSKCGFGI